MKEWGSQIDFLHGSSDARGVAVLFKRGLDIKILNCNKDSEGRFIMLKAEIKEKRYVLVNVYGPNRDNKAVKFFHSLFNSMTQNEYDTEENIIMSGDFNFHLNPTLEKKGNVIAPCYSVINSTENITNTQSFTWSRCKPFIFCRLDFWLILDKLHDLVTNVDRLAAIKTDHSAIFLELEEMPKLDLLSAAVWKIYGGGGPNAPPPPLGLICYSK